MAKLKNIFTNIFTKSSYKLETDAAVIPNRSNDNSEDKNENTNMVQSATATTGSSEDRSTLSAVSYDDQMNTIVPETRPELLDQPTNPSTAGPLTQTIVNNVQNNALTAPQTSITNATGVQVYQIKNARNVHIGNSFTFNSANTEEDRARPSSNVNSPVKWANLKLSHTIKQMMDCEDELDTDMMITISRHLGYEWKHFARILQYSEGQIEAFECDNDTLCEVGDF